VCWMIFTASPEVSAESPHDPSRLPSHVVVSAPHGTSSTPPSPSFSFSPYSICFLLFKLFTFIPRQIAEYYQLEHTAVDVDSVRRAVVLFKVTSLLLFGFVSRSFDLSVSSQI
jgi:hypothetical protein